MIERVLTALNEGWDGALPGLPVSDTIKRVEGERVVETLDRHSLRAVQTPQAFVADVLCRAYEGDLSSATDCASLVEAQGGRVKIVLGDPRLRRSRTPPISSASPRCCDSRLLSDRREIAHETAAVDPYVEAAREAGIDGGHRRLLLW